MDLDDWRSRINNLDEEILKLLNQRGQVALRIGELKRQKDLPYFVPEREAHLPRWRAGVALADGPAVPSAVRLLASGARTSRLAVTFAEGRHREVKRYATALGHPVLHLRRLAFGPLRLGNLAVGGFRPLTAAEINRVKSLRAP